MAEDIYFNTTRNKANNKKYTEHIDESQMQSKPGTHSFYDIKTEDGYIKAQDFTKNKPKKQTRSDTPVKGAASPGKGSQGSSKGNSASSKGAAGKKKKKKKHITLKIFISLLCLFLVSTIALGACVSVVFTRVLDGYNAGQMRDNAYVDEASLLSDGSVYNVLLMGIDNLDTESASRSDAMILLSVDMRSKKLKLTSFLRDSYVTIPGHGNTKLNAACVYGGPQLVCDTIEYNFGIKIDDYAKIGYDMFIEIIDAVGGVVIPEIDAVESVALAREGFSISPGTNIRLNGYQALLYCRIRSGQDDFYRTTRQREVITQVIKGVSGKNILPLIDTATEIAKKVECSIDQSQFLPLAMKAATCLTGEIEQFSIPAEGTWHNDTINSQAVLVMDFEQNKQRLNEFIYNQ